MTGTIYYYKIDIFERERDYVPDGKPDRQEHGEREHRQVPGELPVESAPVDGESRMSEKSKRLPGRPADSRPIRLPVTSSLRTIALLGGLLVVVTALSSLPSASAPAPFTDRQLGD